MSYKIYNGWKLQSADLFGFVAQMRAQLHPLYCRLHDEEVMRRAALNFDLAHLGGHAPNNLHTIWRAWRTECAEPSALNSENNSDPYRTQALFGADPKDQQLYAVLFCHDDQMRHGWSQLPVDDFSYWDNSDEPEEISRTEWKSRRKIWDRVMPDSVPAHSMLSFGIDYLPYLGESAPKDSRPLDWLMALLPSLDQRAERVARDLLGRQAKERMPFPDSGDDLSEVFTVMRQHAEWIDERLTQESARVMSQLLETDALSQKMRSR